MRAAVGAILVTASLLVLGCAGARGTEGGWAFVRGDEVWIRLTPMQARAAEAREREHHGQGHVDLTLSERQREGLQEALREDDVRSRVVLRVRSGGVKKAQGGAHLVRPRQLFSPWRDVLDER